MSEAPVDEVDRVAHVHDSVVVRVHSVQTAGTESGVKQAVENYDGVADVEDPIVVGVSSAKAVACERAGDLVVEGVQFAAGINVGYNISASYLSFKRCRINAGINFQGDLVTNSCVNNSFSECVFIGDIYLTNTTNTAIMNSIIQDRLINSKSNIFKNIVFLFNSMWNNGVLISPFNNEFSNNIFLDPSEVYFILAATDGNLFFNNVFVAANPNLGSNPISTGNYMGVPLADIFENHSGATFSYSSDFHLKSPGDYIGKDSSQAGIYGGLFPFKPGGVPTNPHINFKNISGTTTTDGKLNVQIKADAQSR